jgi:hypothetical protein
MAENLFSLLTILPLPVWLSMLLFPRRRFTQQLVTSPWPFIALGGIYTVLLLVALIMGAGGFDLSFDALRQALSLEWGFLVAWAHFLTLDLFAGVWIFRDAKYWGINPGLYLFLTLVAGPLGLASYLLARQRRVRHDPARTIN